ncbi:sulfur carrier protein TtuB [Thermus filiformis]|uniref:Thiamine biosynthesis protein ThiS n=1 Tax=Thermus filiformis TaxID=276 RepID=A0A0A2WTR0_THEFI|nr:MoaD/ThiS family protein [Thermus filiformis]KGQ22142.2 thiamine biosynthesis protein ThiS [Thermus filiformis]
MRVVLRMPERRELELKGGRPLRAVLEEIGVNPEGVVVVRGEELLTLDAWVEEEDTLEVLSAISGGA